MLTDPSRLVVNGLDLAVGGFALHGVDLECRPGEYHALLGPTGSGKSTLMRCLLGLYRPDAGRILLAGEDITAAPPERRGMSYVPQDYALFPHLNVEHNIRFGLDGRAVDADAMVHQLCDMLGIQALRQRSVRHLSGGERQKLALARALATRPRVLLLDEPFSSIDESGKRKLWMDMREIMDDIGVTTIHITHNLEEACAMGDRLSILLDGRIAQTATHRELLQQPASAAVARFLGYRNQFPGVTSPHPHGTRVDLGGFQVVIRRKLAAGLHVTVCIRQQDVRILRDEPVAAELADNILSGRISRIYGYGDACVAWLAIDGTTDKVLEMRFPSHVQVRHRLRRGRRLTIGVYEPGLLTFRSHPAH